MQAHEVQTPILLDKDTALMKSLRVKYFPTKFLIKNGEIVNTGSVTRWMTPSCSVNSDCEVAMQKVLLSLLLAATFGLPAVVAQQSPPKAGDGSTTTAPSKLPKEVSLVLEVTESPGLADHKSFWEGDYEIRIADWSSVVAATKSGDDTRRLGKVLVRSSFAPRAFSQKNAPVRISIPVSNELLNRLAQQTKIPQAFLLSSTLQIYDAKLNQNLAFDLNRVWRSEHFPEGEAKIAITVKPDGGYSTWGPIPKVLPSGYTIVGGQTKSSAPKP